MKKKISILILCFMLTLLASACTIGLDGNKIDVGGNISFTEGTLLTEEEDISQNAEGIKTLEIVNNAGNIKVLHSDKSDITVKLTKKVKGTDEVLKKETMENIKVNLDKKSDKLTVSARSKDDSGSYIWDWVNKLKKAVNVTIDYEVAVPDDVKIYKVNNNAGNMSFESISGEMNISQNAGDIKLVGVNLLGKNSFTLNAGNINMDMTIDKTDEIKVKLTAGNINISIPEDSKFELDSKLVAGNLSGSFLKETSIKSGSLKQEFNGGGTKLTVNLTTGNATIDSKK